MILVEGVDIEVGNSYQFISIHINSWHIWLNICRSMLIPSTPGHPVSHMAPGAFEPSGVTSRGRFWCENA